MRDCSVGGRSDSSNLARAIGSSHTITQPRADVLVVVEDVVGVVLGLHLHEPFVDGVAVRLADPVGLFVAGEEVDVDTFAEPAEGGGEPSLKTSFAVAEFLARPPRTMEDDGVRCLPVPERGSPPSATRLTAPFR